MDSQKLLDSVKFLLKSVRQLSDRFIETSDNVKRSFESVRRDVSDLAVRLEKLETELLNLRDQGLLAAEPLRIDHELPIRADSKERIIPILNLPFETLVNIYRNTPVLLQPFARPCSVSARTLAGSISEIELEVFAQGTTWVIETSDGNWLLLPRPGLLLRQTQVDSLGRLFDWDTKTELPAETELMKPGTATVVEHGRRWYLKEKGLIGIHADPLQQSLEKRLRALEAHLPVSDSASEP